MKIILAGNKNRGISCLNALKTKHKIVGVIGNKKSKANNEFVDTAFNLGFNVYQPQDVNDSKFINEIKILEPDIIVLAGYGSIVKPVFISTAKFGCINLHGGKLPEYRGSSPMNWALINGEKNFTITIINVDKGVDTGDILLEKTFSIKENDSIIDLHAIANKHFPKMLLNVLELVKTGKLIPKIQEDKKSSYYPLRFPDDGIIFFDQLTAIEIHNRVKALTDPYPGVFTYYKKNKIKILKSKLTSRPIYGEPGRIYRLSNNAGILVCAKDRCLWLKEIKDVKSGKDYINNFKRYEKLSTMKDVIINYYDNS